MILLLIYGAWMGLMAVGYGGTAAERGDDPDSAVSAHEDGYGIITTLR